MSETITFIKHPVPGKLPPINRALLVETKEGRRVVAAKHESSIKKNEYFWGYIKNKVIIGVVDDVEFWFEEVKTKVCPPVSK